MILSLLRLACFIAPSFFINSDPLPAPLPAGTMGGLSEEAKFVQRTKEIANGRLAMIAIVSFFSASFIPGSVPFIP